MVRLLLAVGILFGFLRIANEPPYLITAGSRIDGDVATTTQPILVEGIVLGDVTSWSGDIHISGAVEGDVVSYTGHITIAAEGVVNGSIYALAGELTIEPGAQAARSIKGGVGGQFVSRMAGIFSPLPTVGVGQASTSRLLFSLILGMGLLLFCLLPAVIWPRRSATAADLLEQSPGRVMAIGLLAGVALLSLLPLFAGVLALTLIGIPLALILLLVINVPFALGFAVLTRAADHTLRQQQHGPAIWLTAIALTLPVMLISFISPLAGLIAFYLVGSPGMGALILSQAGTYQLASRP
ncbi:MAG: hypothetical protein Fur005_19370 [Roseiflexaceae bacterium]